MELYALKRNCLAETDALQMIISLLCFSLGQYFCFVRSPHWIKVENPAALFFSLHILLPSLDPRPCNF